MLNKNLLVSAFYLRVILYGLMNLSSISNIINAVPINVEVPATEAQLKHENVINLEENEISNNNSMIKQILYEPISRQEKSLILQTEKEQEQLHFEQLTNHEENNNNNKTVHQENRNENHQDVDVVVLNLNITTELLPPSTPYSLNHETSKPLLHKEPLSSLPESEAGSASAINDSSSSHSKIVEDEYDVVEILKEAGTGVEFLISNNDNIDSPNNATVVDNHLVSDDFNNSYPNSNNFSHNDEDDVGNVAGHEPNIITRAGQVQLSIKADIGIVLQEPEENSVMAPSYNEPTQTSQVNNINTSVLNHEIIEDNSFDDVIEASVAATITSNDLNGNNELMMEPKIGKEGTTVVPWTNGLIPYMLDNTFSEYERVIIATTVAVFAKLTCVRVIPRSDEENFIIIYKNEKKDCSSVVGMRGGGPQKMTLTSKCIQNPRNILHEFMHVIGFQHEHVRPDRDEHLIIHWDNILEYYLYKFTKIHGYYANAPVNGPYDPLSITHYSRHAKGIDKKVDTLTPKDSKMGNKIGIGKELTELDIKKIRAFYDCPDGEEEDKVDIEEEIDDDDEEPESEL